jgi:hypothetical protein
MTNELGGAVVRDTTSRDAKSLIPLRSIRERGPSPTTRLRDYYWLRGDSLVAAVIFADIRRKWDPE